MDRLTEEALGHLEQALAYEPSHIPSLVALSKAYMEQNDFVRVETILGKALSKTKDQSELYFIQAKLLSLQNNHVHAAGAIGKAIELNDSDPKYYKLASNVARMSNNSTENQFFLERLIDLEPLNGLAHYELGQLLHHPDDFDRGILLWEIAIDLLPGDVRPLYSLAQKLYVGEKSSLDGTIRLEPDLEYSKKLLQKVISLSPNHGKAKMLLAEIELLEGEEQAAEALYKELLKDNDLKGKAALQIGQIKQRNGDKEKSKFYYEHAIKSKETKALGEFLIGTTLKEEGKLKEAERFFKKSILSFEEELKLTVKSKKDLLQKSNFHGSRKKIQSLQNIRKYVGRAHFGIFKCKYKKQNNVRGSEILDLALNSYPNFSEANYEKGLLLLDSGEVEQANNYLIKSVECDWEYWPAHLKLGEQANSSGDKQKAEMHFKIVLDLDPENRVAQKNLKRLGKNYIRKTNLKRNSKD